MISALLLPALVLGAPGAPAGAVLAAPQDERVDDLVRRGREYLDRGELGPATELFRQADVESGGALKSRMWVLRTWFEEGRINDAFGEVDRLAERHGGPELDYLYGIGSYLKALGYLAQGVDTATIDFSFQDARGFLAKAVKADPDRFYDAFYPLADAAYRTRDYEVAAAAAKEAMEREPTRPRAFHLAGRVAFQRAQAAAAVPGAAPPDHAAALALYDEALARIPDRAQAKILTADIQLDAGIAHHYAEDLAAARACYADALGWNPNVMDLGQYWGTLGTAEEYIAMLEDAAAKFTERWGADSPADATMLWHLGYAYHDSRRFAECEATYARVLEKWPDYVDANFYVALSRYQQQDYDGAIDAWYAHSQANRENLLQLLAGDTARYVPILTYVMDRCAGKALDEEAPEPEYNLRATFLAELRAEVAPTSWRHHNDLGFFALESAKFLRERGREGDAEYAVRLFEQARAAYEEAMRLAPEMPHLPNDLAVVLHYYLERDYDRAMELYERSLSMATDLLAAGGLDEEMQLFAETAKSDAELNIAALKEKLEGDGR